MLFSSSTSNQHAGTCRCEIINIHCWSPDCNGIQLVFSKYIYHFLNDIDIWCFLCCWPENGIEQTVGLSVIWDVMPLVWVYCDGIRVHVLSEQGFNDNACNVMITVPLILTSQSPERGHNHNHRPSTMAESHQTLRNSSCVVLQNIHHHSYLK